MGACDYERADAMRFTKDGKYSLQYDMIHQVIKDTAQGILKDGKQRTLRISTSQKSVNGNIVETFGVARHLVGTKGHSKVAMDPSNTRKLVEEHISFLEAVGYSTDVNVMEVVYNAFNEHLDARQRCMNRNVAFFGNTFIELGFPQKNQEYVCINVDVIVRLDDEVVFNKSNVIRLYQQGMRVIKVSKTPKDTDDGSVEMK